MRVKICGLRTEIEVYDAVRAGADALGFVFYAPSKRFVSIARAKRLLACVPPFVQKVGLFVDADVGFVREAVASLSLDLLQFHGQESPDFCAQFSRAWIKAVPMRDLLSDEALLDYCAQYKEASGFLLDNFGKAQMGGSGQRFLWRNFPDLGKPLLLAGGLTVENVREAVALVRPWAVDVSSGVEDGCGVKSFVKMASFVVNARAGCDG